MNLCAEYLLHSRPWVSRGDLWEQLAGRDRQEQEMIQDYALGAVETSRRRSSSAGGWGGQAVLSEEAEHL